MVTPCDLYRNGNATGPRLAAIRDCDVNAYEVKGVTWVYGRQRGISCFDASAAGVIAGKNWWKLPSGSTVGAGLYLCNDNNPPGHWAFQPDVDMPLAHFGDLLSAQGMTVAQGGQWTGPTTNGWPGPTSEQEVDGVTGASSAATGSAAAGKAHDFVLRALDHQIESMEGELDAEENDDLRSDLINDLVLYRLIRRQLATQGPAGR